MSNYRGGERSFSNYGLENMKAIKDQTTERQIERNQLKKIIMGVSQAGLMGISGLMKGSESADAAAATERKRGIMQSAITNATQARDNTPAPYNTPESASFQDMAKSAMDDAVAKGRQAQKTNAAAYLAPVNGEYTAGGLGDMNNEVATGADDLNTSKRLLGVGGGTGIGGSMKTWGDDS